MMVTWSPPLSVILLSMSQRVVALLATFPRVAAPGQMLSMKFIGSAGEIGMTGHG